MLFLVYDITELCRNSETLFLFCLSHIIDWNVGMEYWWILKPYETYDNPIPLIFNTPMVWSHVWVNALRLEACGYLSSIKYGLYT